MMAKLRPKCACEVCGLKKHLILHRHHIIPRVDPRCTNSDNNLAIVCPNCHSLIHTGEIIVIGLYQTTDGLQLMWFGKGKSPPLPEEFWHIKENPLVITIGGNEDDYPEE
jgi:hypothetical protein